MPTDDCLGKQLEMTPLRDFSSHKEALYKSIDTVSPSVMMYLLGVGGRTIDIDHDAIETV